LVAVGEATGALADLLAEAARFYEERLDASLQRLTALMEPVLMLIVGTLVGGVIVAMYLPIFGMADVIR
jgi:type IV pilus assembly protein PilC